MLPGAEPEELDTESTVQDTSGQVTKPAAENTGAPVEESTPESSPDEGSAGESAPEKMSDRDVMRHTASLWRYRTVAENGTELHTEYHCKRTRTGVGEIIGARVRGKKHKHEGTNCDDWFETAVAEDALSQLLRTEPAPSSFRVSARGSAARRRWNTSGTRYRRCSPGTGD